MMNVAEYKRAVQWLQRGMAELALKPESQTLQDSVERILRETLVEVYGDKSVGHLSSRELMRYAEDEGLHLSSGEQWLRYGLALERARETLGESFSDDVLPLLPQYRLELELFATRLEGRLALVA